jgi:hypothetical protein
VEEWLEINQDWIKDLAYNEFRYVPLPEGVNETIGMMICVYRCPGYGLFALAPTYHDPAIAGIWNSSAIKYDWKNVNNLIFNM